ncbi:S9 family peptidase [Sphingobacterium sp. SGR-19]|uniref:S9 family peptidase n=1 Tax=Sphingobacterium sp. SGR-19 TaxID=2710886 RepID=UPI0013EDA5DB|nr:prolyl oligopeptidase family serine peptidase [Sphingobacterium sp. SGR-19]NGM64978.1 S9 family peptidase [Sphingobacterium sp. SGR-19]
MFRFLLWTFVVCLFVVSVSCGSKQNTDKLIPIEDFFVKPEKSNFKISPDGRRIAYLGVDDHCRNIFVLDLQEKSKSKQLTYQSDMNVQYFFWASDSLIVYSNSHSPQDSLRIYSIFVDSERTTPLLPVKNARLRWLAPHTLHDNYLLATLNNRDSTVFDLYKIFVDGSAPQLLIRNPGNISKWFASPDGKVRLAMTNDSVQESILYRTDENMPFQQIAHTDYQTSIRPLGFVKDSHTHIYALSNENRDRLSLVEYNVSTGEEERLIFEHSEVDLQPVGYSDHLQELIFSQYTINKVKQHFFHQTFQRHFDKLSAKFGNQSIDILDTDTSMRHWIVKVYTDVHAGGIYHYNVLADTAILLEEMNPKLSRANLSPKEPVSFQSRDGLTLHGYLTYPLTGKRETLPVVVLVHDGPNRRETSDFDAEVQFLANRGYLVFQLNYRGSSGYGKKFWAAGFKEWGGKIQADMIDGVTWLIHQGIVDKNRVAIMGSGFGGYSALHAATYNSSFYKCAISMSGYTNLFTYFREIPPHHQQYVRLFYNIIGNPSKEYELFKAISPVFHADKVKIPVLFAQGGKDRFSSLTDANQFVQKLKNNNVPIKYIYREEEGRRFRNEENIINYYQEVEAFLKQYL